MPRASIEGGEHGEWPCTRVQEEARVPANLLQIESRACAVGRAGGWGADLARWRRYGKSRRAGPLGEAGRAVIAGDCSEAWEVPQTCSDTAIRRD